MNAQEFMAKWGPGGPAFELNERQGAQPLEGGAVIPEIRGQSPISPEALSTDPNDGAAKSGSDPKLPAAATSKEIDIASTSTEARTGRMSGAISKSEAYEPPASVARAYGWSDYSADIPDETILIRLLAMNLQRSAPSA